MLRFRGISYLPVGVVIAASVLVGSSVVLYRQIVDYKTQQPATSVLGAATSSVTRCTDPTIMQESLNALDRTVTLYAPDKTVTMNIGQFSKCVSVTSCTDDVSSCGLAHVSVKPACVADYFNTYNVGLTTATTITGNNIMASLRKEDWSVNTGELSQQLATAFEEEVTYCQIVGQTKATKKNIGNIQVPVSNDLPSAQGNFAPHFIEVDKSRQVLFYWNDAVYQVFTIPHGVSLPKEGIYLARDVNFANWVASIDRGYMQRTVKGDFPVIVHQ